MSARISSSTLPDQLASRHASQFPPGSTPAVTEGEMWMRVLRFPMESSNPLGDENRLLDPISVISRMFSIRANSVFENFERRSGQDDEEDSYPLSWALRISDDIEPGQVLGMLWKMADEQRRGGDYYRGEGEEFMKIIDKVDELFPGLGIKSPTGDVSLEDNIKSRLEELRAGLMIHVSSPHFHDFWRYMEFLSESEFDNDPDLVRNAKEYWSISLPIMMEKAATEQDGFTCLQSGGGHLLVFKSGSSLDDPMAHTLELLQGMEEWFIANNSGWSPPLSASYYYENLEKRGWNGLPSTLVGQSDLSKDALRKMYDKYRSGVEKRKRGDIKKLWAQFGPTRRKLQDSRTVDKARIYLDFIGLGDKCWPKPDDGSQTNSMYQQGPTGNAEEDEQQVMVYKSLRSERPRDFDVLSPMFQMPIPVLPREQGPVPGFKYSQRLTGFIESTIGAVISNVNTTEIHTLGGDEIEADIDSRDFHILVEAIEKHSLDYYIELLPDEGIELSWWLACSHQEDIDREEIMLHHIKRAKQHFRPARVAEAKSSQGPLDMGTKFVHVIWSDYLKQIKSSDDS